MKYLKKLFKTQNKPSMKNTSMLLSQSVGDLVESLEARCLMTSYGAAIPITFERETTQQGTYDWNMQKTVTGLIPGQRVKLSGFDIRAGRSLANLNAPFDARADINFAGENIYDIIRVRPSGNVSANNNLNYSKEFTVHSRDETLKTYIKTLFHYYDNRGNLNWEAAKLTFQLQTENLANLTAIAPKITNNSLTYGYQISGSAPVDWRGNNVSAQVSWAYNDNGVWRFSSPIASTNLDANPGGPRLTTIPASSLQRPDPKYTHLVTTIDRNDRGVGVIPEPNETDNIAITPYSALIGDVSVSSLAWNSSGGVNLKVSSRLGVGIDSKSIPANLFWVGQWPESGNVRLAKSLTVKSGNTTTVDAKSLIPPVGVTGLLAVVDPDGNLFESDENNNGIQIPLASVPSYMSDAPGSAKSEDRVRLWMKKYENLIIQQSRKFNIDSRAIAGTIAWEALKGIPSTSQLPGDQNQNSWAILYGADDYSAFRNNHAGYLGGSTSDLGTSEDVYNMNNVVQKWGIPASRTIVRYRGNAYTGSVMGSDISEASITSDLNGLSNKGFDADDTLVFYYAGHGSSTTLDGTDIPSTINTENLVLPDGSFFRDWQFANALKSLPQSSIKVVILDSCCSGGFTELLSVPNTLVVTAVQANEYAAEAVLISPSTWAQSQGLFTSAFTKGILSGSADVNMSGNVSLREAYNYANIQIANPTQHPLFLNNIGDFAPGEVMSPNYSSPGNLPSGHQNYWDLANGSWIVNDVERMGLVPLKTKSERDSLLATPEGAIKYTAAALGAYALVGESAGLRGRGGVSLRNDAATLASLFRDYPERRNIQSFTNYARSLPAGTRLSPRNGRQSMGYWVSRNISSPGKDSDPKFYVDSLVQHDKRLRPTLNNRNKKIRVSSRATARVQVEAVIDQETGTTFNLSSTLSGLYGDSNVAEGAVNYTPGSNFKIGDSILYTISNGIDTIGGGFIDVDSSPSESPSSLSVNRRDATSVDINWIDNSNDESSFVLEYKADGNVWNRKKISAQPGTGSRSFTFSNMEIGAQYAFRISSLSQFDTESTPSNEAAITMQFPAPSSLQAVAITETSIELAWTDNNDNEAEYRIYMSTDGDHWRHIAVTHNNQSTYRFENAQPSTKYYFLVRAAAKDTTIQSDNSNILEVTTPSGKPAAPTNLRVANLSPNSVDLVWNDNSDNEAEFRIYMSTDGSSWRHIAVTHTNESTYRYESAQPSTQYYFLVRSARQDTTIQSDNSNILEVSTPSGKPPAPTNLRMMNVWSHIIDITWKDNSDNEAGFRIYMSTDGSHWRHIGVTRSNDVVYRYTDATPSTKYYFLVRAATSDNTIQSENSNIMTVTTRS